MADRRTRFTKVLKNVTLYGAPSIDSAATLTNSGTISGGTITGAEIQGHAAAVVAAMVHGVASGDTSRDSLKMAAGHLAVTGSEQINTGLTQVLSASANLENMSPRNGTLTPWLATCRVPKPAGKAPGNTKGNAYFTVKVLCSDASTEAAVAASVDWQAIGT